MVCSEHFPCARDATMFFCSHFLKFQMWKRLRKSYFLEMVLYFYFCLNLLIVGCLCEKDEDLQAVGDTKATKANVDLNNVVFVVVTQTSKHHTSIANVTVNTLKKNLIENGVRDPKVCDTQKDFPVKGGWTFFPIFPALYDQVRNGP